MRNSSPRASPSRRPHSSPRSETFGVAQGCIAVLAGGRRTLAPGRQARVREDFNQVQAAAGGPSYLRVFRGAKLPKKSCNRRGRAEQRTPRVRRLHTAAHPRDQARRHSLDWPHSGRVGHDRRLVQGDDRERAWAVNVTDVVESAIEPDQFRWPEIHEPDTVEMHGADRTRRLGVVSPGGIEAYELGGPARFRI